MKTYTSYSDTVQLLNITNISINGLLMNLLNVVKYLVI
jgi:hypothetical protein